MVLTYINTETLCVNVVSVHIKLDEEQIHLLQILTAVLRTLPPVAGRRYFYDTACTFVLNTLLLVKTPNQFSLVELLKFELLKL